MMEQYIPEKMFLPKDQTSISSIEILSEKLRFNQSTSLPEMESKAVKTIYKLPIEKVSKLSQRENIKRALTLDSNYICYINQENSITIKSIEYAFLNSTIEVPQSRVLDICLFENINFSVLGIIYENGVISGYRIELSDSKATIYTNKILNHSIEGQIQKPQLMWKDSTKLSVAIKNELTIIELNTEKKNNVKDEEVDLFKPKSFNVLRFDHGIKDYGFSPKYSLVYLLFENNLVQAINTDNGFKIREFVPHLDTNSNVKKLLSYKNLAKQDPVNVIGQKIEVNKDRDYSLKDIFITLTEGCEIKVWDLSEWEKEKKSYYCIETYQLNGNLNESELSLKFCFFDPIKNSLFVACSKKNNFEICVIVLKINQFFQTYQENYKDLKKTTKFFQSLEKVEFEETELIGIAALNSTKSQTQEHEQSNSKNNTYSTSINFAVRSSKPQAKFNFLIRNDTHTSFLSVFDPQLPENLVRRERSNSHLNTIIDGSNESPRSKLLRLNREYNPMQLAWEPRNLNKILSGVQLGSPLLENIEAKRKQSFEEFKKQDLNKSFGGTILGQSLSFIGENEKIQTHKTKKNKQRRKKNHSVVEPFVPGDKELEDYQDFVKRESQALLEQLNKSELSYNNIKEDENRVLQHKDSETIEQISLDFAERQKDKFFSSSNLEKTIQDEKKIENQKDHQLEKISTELIDSLINKKIMELKLDTLENRIKSDFESRINQEVANTLEKQIESYLEKYSNNIYEKLNLTFEYERKFYIDKLGSFQQEYMRSINEMQNNSTQVTNFMSQALAQSLDNIQQLEKKLFNKCSEFDQFISKTQKLFKENCDLHIKINKLEKIIESISSVYKYQYQTEQAPSDVSNRNSLESMKEELSNSQKGKKKTNKKKKEPKNEELQIPQQKEEIFQQQISHANELQPNFKEIQKVTNSLLLQNSANNQNFISPPQDLDIEQVQRLNFPWSASIVEPRAFSDEANSQDNFGHVNNNYPNPNILIHFNQFIPNPNLIQHKTSPSLSGFPPGLSMSNDNFTMNTNQEPQIKPHRHSFDLGVSFIENKFPSKSRLSFKHLESSEEPYSQREEENQKRKLKGMQKKSKDFDYYKKSQESYEDLVLKDLLPEDLWDEL